MRIRSRISFIVTQEVVETKPNPALTLGSWLVPDGWKRVIAKRTFETVDGSYPKAKADQLTGDVIHPAALGLKRDDHSGRMTRQYWPKKLQ